MSQSSTSETHDEHELHDTKAGASPRDGKFREIASRQTDLAALELRVAEHTQQLEVIDERLQFISMVLDAHDGLFQREESSALLLAELDARGKVIEDLQRVIEERTDWAERMVTEAEQRGALLEQLQAVVDARNGQMEDLQRQLDERTALVGNLQRLVDERTAWAESLLGIIDERTAWAERMVDEAEQRGSINEQLQAQIAAITSIEPDGARPSVLRRLRSLAGRARRRIFG